MTKKEIVKILEFYDDDSEVVFTTETQDFLNLIEEGLSINHVIEVKNQEASVIVFVE